MDFVDSGEKTREINQDTGCLPLSRGSGPPNDDDRKMTTTEKKKLESSSYNTLKKSRTLTEGSSDTSPNKTKTGKAGKRTRQVIQHILPELVLECGSSMGIKLDGESGEHCLLAVAMAALTAEVQKPWELREDSKGKRFLYNCRTGLRAKYHPLEKVYAKAVVTLREQNYCEANKSRAWLKLKDEAGLDFWYNAKTGERKEGEESAFSPPEGDEIKAATLPDGLLPSFPVQDPGHANTADLVQSVKLLSFKSWWYEDSEEPTLGNGSSAGSGLKKRYVTLEYDLVAKTFRIILEENVAIDVSDVQSKRKLPIECWDLYIGATLDILGKNTTLQQGSFDTIQWLDYKAARLLALKKDLLQVLQKYRTASVPAAWSFALNNKPGCCSLRHLMYQIEQLKAELSKFRPSLASKFTITDVLET